MTIVTTKVGKTVDIFFNELHRMHAKRNSCYDNRGKRLVIYLGDYQISCLNHYFLLTRQERLPDTIHGWEWHRVSTADYLAIHFED